MHPMPQSNAVDLKYPKSFLLGTSALVCLALAAPVMADDFVITSGSTTNDGNTIDGNDSVTVTGALVMAAGRIGISTTGDNNIVTVSNTASIDTAETIQYYTPPYGQSLARAIYNDGGYNETTVQGNINTSGLNSPGILNNGDYNETIVSGSITTAGSTSHGIYEYGSNNSITTSGSITIEGDYSSGIYNGDGYNETTVSGSITTAGRTSHGIYEYGSYSSITIFGSITTEGYNSYGIYNYNDDEEGNEIIVSGSITTEGDNSYGIHNRWNNNTTDVSGSITTAGVEAHGIYNEDDYNETTVSGSITTAGDDAFGIRNSGDDNTTTISGTVKATGTKSAALYSSGDRNSFTLDEGATIIGDILSNTNAGTTNSKLIFNLGASTSYAYSVSGAGEGTGGGQWTFSDLDGRTQGVTTDGNGCDFTIEGVDPDDTCNLVTAVSTGNLEAQDELQFSMNTSMIGSVSLGSSNSTAPVEAMSFVQTPQHNTWVNIYGDTSERSTSTAKLAFDGSNRGLTIGTPVSINDTLNLDLVFNASNANLDIGSAREQQITAKSYNVGAVLRDLAPSTGWTVDAFGFVGRNSYDGKRKVMNNQEATGSETVTAAYSGSEVLVGVDAQYSNPVTDTLNFIGGVNASLSNEKIGAYSESKYFSWDARTMTQTTGGITAGLEYHTDALTTFASVGLQGSSLRSGKTATYTNNGTAGSFTDNSAGDTRRSVTVGFDYAGNEGMTFSGAVEAFSSTGGVSGNSASLTANWSF